MNHLKIVNHAWFHGYTSQLELNIDMMETSVMKELIE